MRKILILFFSLLIMFSGAAPALAINLDLYGSVAAYHEYRRLHEGTKVFDDYLLINTKARTTGNTATFAYLDLDWRFAAVFSSQTSTKETSAPAVNEAYLNIPLRAHFVLTAGKKRFPPGVGFAYNPVDFIDAPASPFRPELKQGVYSWGLASFGQHTWIPTVLIIIKLQLRLEIVYFSFPAQFDLNFLGLYNGRRKTQSS